MNYYLIYVGGHHDWIAFNSTHWHYTNLSKSPEEMKKQVDSHAGIISPSLRFYREIQVILKCNNSKLFQLSHPLEWRRL